MVLRDSLGIFDTPPDRKQIRFAVLVAVLLVAAFLLILPVRDVPLRRIDGFMPTIDAIMFVGDCITATLLFAQGSVFRSRALMTLAAGYLYSALLLIPHALTFPGAFSPTGLLDAGINTTGWIATLQRLAFPIVIIQYVQFKRVETAPRLQRERPEGAGLWIAAAISLAIAVTVLTTAGHDLLPPFYSNDAKLIYANSVAYQSLMFALLLVAVPMLIRTRRSVLDLWLLVALFGWLIQTALIMTLHARFTAGFYCLYGIVVASHLVVMIALVAESNRLYARLALSTTARDVEREARLMSMDAVAAAIATQVGQSLAAISLNASVGTCSLEGRKPNVAKAIAALGEIRDSAKRSFDMVGNVRSIFARAPEAAGEFSLNELIDETAPLLDSELSASKIALKLRLGEEMPPMRGSRVQLQQVLLALAKNATESAGTPLNGHRTFTVSSRAEARKIVLEVSDDGMGVAPEEVPHLFDAIQNDDGASTSIGLSLCRSIVEEHGGRIQAAHDDELGATFHLEFPNTASASSARSFG
jgi:signal transduction histidine kinase